MSLEKFNGVDKLREIFKRADNVSAAAPLMTNDTAVEPVFVQQPEGPLYAVLRQNVAGRSRRVYMGLTRAEAEKKKQALNEAAKKARNAEEETCRDRAIEYKPSIDSIVFYEIAEMGGVQEDPYWNPRPVISSEHFQ